jgi:uncharacterized protein YaiL (DUF2058 family)
MFKLAKNRTVST